MAFSPSRLSIARKRRMLNKKGFAEALGVSHHTVVRWEGGDTEAPSDENIKSFSRLLGFPESFFFGEELEEPERASFRSQTSMTAAIREASLSAGAIGFMISDWVETRFDLPEVTVPDLSQYEPEMAARVLREEWKIGERPISNILHLLESKGVRVFSLAENTVKVNAYSIWRNEKPYVFLNSYKSAESSRFDAAHELGHLVLHQDGEFTGRDAEDQANKFASAFLMPRSDILANINDISYYQKLIQAKKRWRVSVAALNYRIHKIGLISDWRYRDYCIEIATRGHNKNEPEPIERERSKVWEMILRALWSEKVTPADIARELRLPESELSGLVFGIVADLVKRPEGPIELSVVT